MKLEKKKRRGTDGCKMFLRRNVVSDEKKLNPRKSRSCSRENKEKYKLRGERCGWKQGKRKVRNGGRGRKKPRPTGTRVKKRMMTRNR